MRVRGLRTAGGLSALFAVVAVNAGCRQEMYDQPRYKPLAKSTFFEDGRSARPLVEGTVARGSIDPLAPAGGGAPGSLATTLPMPLTRELLVRGRERYGIFCAPCHDATGSGRGMVVRRGYRPPPTLHIERLRDAPVGHLYDVITRGVGAMPDYAQQIPPADRWAIAAYVRALQLSQRAAPGDVPAGERSKLETGDRPRFPESTPSQEGQGGNRGLSPEKH
ncbi:MAG TPA: cytochrome c [Thermoanaerobaculia bacterium]|nr:cytochrome c [Thermoanaerobaculia bacterium]